MEEGSPKGKGKLWERSDIYWRCQAPGKCVYSILLKMDLMPSLRSKVLAPREVQALYGHMTDSDSKSGHPNVPLILPQFSLSRTFKGAYLFKTVNNRNAQHHQFSTHVRYCARHFQMVSPIILITWFPFYRWRHRDLEEPDWDCTATHQGKQDPHLWP